MSGNLCRCGAYANIIPAVAEVLLIRSPDAERRSDSFVGDRNKEVLPIRSPDAERRSDSGVYPERSEWVGDRNKEEVQ
jgi:xanthine dehydrogenase iron-sulfur cluster and FAD-binding subunit A